MHGRGRDCLSHTLSTAAAHMQIGMSTYTDTNTHTIEWDERVWPTRCVHILIRIRGNGLLLSVLCEGINNLTLRKPVNVGLWKVRMYSNVCAHLQKTLKDSKGFLFIYHFMHLHSSKPFSIMFLLFQYCVFSCVLNPGLVVHLDRFVCLVLCVSTLQMWHLHEAEEDIVDSLQQTGIKCSNIKNNETS